MSLRLRACFRCMKVILGRNNFPFARRLCYVHKETDTVPPPHKGQVLPVLFTKGTHYEVGYSIGSVFGGRIRKYLISSSLVQNRLLPFYKTSRGRDIYEEYLDAAEKSFPQYVKEIRGMADGSGMPFEHLFLMNFSKEVYSVHYYELQAEASKQVNGCSTVHINRPDTKILAHNEDAEPMIAPNSYIVSAHIIDQESNAGIVKNTEEHFTAFSYPGFLPGYAFGFNKHGMVFSINELCPKKASVGSSPVSIICRALLSASSMDEVIRIARNKGYGSADGFNINVASLNCKEMWSLEVGPGKPESRLQLTVIPEQEEQSKDCHYFHFNQYKHIKDVAERSGLESSVSRAKRAEEIAPPKTVQDVKVFLGDTGNCSYPLFRRPNDIDDSTTACTAVFDIKQKTMEIYTENPAMNSSPVLKLPLTF
ncbi:hypothetical protein ACJMK2_014122 [Sinanodonta woodiana]|uniref:Peptidase C45 hydrolase domain-containing protein n=1 Tax=Sinanodonta woodiana TaxID=1069815 RepID=A0ABD3UZM2_SINWO